MVPRIVAGMTMAQPVRRAYSSRPAFSRLRSRSTSQQPTTGDIAFIIGSIRAFINGNILGYFCLASCMAGYFGYEKFKKWKAEEQKFKEDIHNLKKYDIREVQHAVQKLDHCFKPGEAAKEARLAEDKLKDQLYTATRKATVPVRVPDIRSKNTFEQVAAMYHDAEQKDRLRKIWDRSPSIFGKDEGEKIREELEAWGIRVLKTGNPFRDGGKGFWWFR